MSTKTNPETETRTLAEWSIPSRFEGTADLVIRAEQTESGRPRIVVDGEIWVDYRIDQVAATLREFVKALDPKGPTQ